MTRKKGIDIEIDRLTNSIINVISGDVFDTEFHKVTKKEIKKKDWLFNWSFELGDKKAEVYKMTIRDNVSIIQGLISYVVSERDRFIFVNLAESAKFNRGKEKIYAGVGGNLFAFACKKSKEMGFDGVVVFQSKTALVTYYKNALGAEVLFGQRMVIEDIAAEKLIKQYFKN